jgi:hypothetical protein
VAVHCTGPRSPQATLACACIHALSARAAPIRWPRGWAPLVAHAFMRGLLLGLTSSSGPGAAAVPSGGSAPSLWHTTTSNSLVVGWAVGRTGCHSDSLQRQRGQKHHKPACSSRMQPVAHGMAGVAELGPHGVATASSLCLLAASCSRVLPGAQCGMSAWYVSMCA